eukprot:1546130-Prymnesium_polylepis.1
MDAAVRGCARADSVHFWCRFQGLPQVTCDGRFGAKSLKWQQPSHVSPSSAISFNLITSTTNNPRYDLREDSRRRRRSPANLIAQKANHDRFRARRLRARVAVRQLPGRAKG